MNTKLIKIKDLADEDGIAEAAALLREGKLVAIPTETVYGLAANAFDGAAVSAVFAAKGRPADNPLIVHIADLSMLSELTPEIPEKAMTLAEKYWPGPLTMIFRKSGKIPDEVSAGLYTVAVRFPSNPVASAIISACRLPLAAPSANLSGSPSPTTAEHVVNDLFGRVDGIVMSGNCEVGVESTVISMVSDPPRLLRPGAVTLEMLRSAIGEVEVDPAVLSKLEEGTKAASPGMKYKHYAPKTRVIMIEGEGEAFCEYVNKNAGKDAAALCFLEDADKLCCKTVTYGGQDDGEEQARELFNALRKIDETGADIAFAHAPSKSGVGLAVYNRLIRAAAFKVVKV